MGLWPKLGHMKEWSREAAKRVMSDFSGSDVRRMKGVETSTS